MKIRERPSLLSVPFNFIDLLEYTAVIFVLTAMTLHCQRLGVVITLSDPTVGVDG